ncbi:MAG: response regulator [Candidatus Uhrbacteria bacterium]
MTTDDDLPRELFTASEVAGFCQVDLKTIHNWAERGEVRHFRTPGRHLRFRRVDVLDFLRRYGYPIPEVLLGGKPRILVIDDDTTSLATVKRALSKRFEVATYSDPFDALIAIGAAAPDGVVLELELPAFDALRCVARLKQLSATRHARTVAFSTHEELKKEALKAGASAFVVKPDVNKLKETLEALMGLERL